MMTVLFICAPLSGFSQSAAEEIARVRSPDGLVEALLTRDNPGATADYAYKLYLVLAGITSTPYDPVLVADNVVEPAIAWVMPKFLTFSYREARIFRFSNFWQSRDVQNFAYIVEIRLEPASASYSLGVE